MFERVPSGTRSNSSRPGSMISMHFAERRSQALLADHRRVREAADARGSYSVKALLPPDVIGLFVLLPHVD